MLVAWGDARWSRTQLLGEIARGHWGLGKASVCELTAGPPERWAGLDGRLCFSPTTEMTEDFMRDAERQMQAAHQEAERNHSKKGRKRKIAEASSSGPAQYKWKQERAT